MERIHMQMIRAPAPAVRPDQQPDLCILFYREKEWEMSFSLLCKESIR